MTLQFEHPYTHFSFLALPYACNGTGARHLPYSTDLDFYYNCRFASVFLLFVAYTHFSSFLASLPYPMPCMVVPSCTPMSSLWNAKNWLCPAVEHLEALVSIVAPMNFVEVSMVVTAYLHAGIPWQDVTSLLSVSPRMSCLGRASFSGTCSNRGSRLVDAVVIYG